MNRILSRSLLAAAALAALSPAHAVRRRSIGMTRPRNWNGDSGSPRASTKPTITPTRRPWTSTSGPPLTPGLIAAVV